MDDSVCGNLLNLGPGEVPCARPVGHSGPCEPAPTYGQEDLDHIAQVFDHCMGILKARQASYGSQWKKYGWRGALYNARRKVERAWAQLWDAEPDSPTGRHMGVDDLYDTINYCAMTLLAIEEGNRDGEGDWW